MQSIVSMIMAVVIAGCLFVAALTPRQSLAQTQTTDTSDEAQMTALALATLLRDGRQVISSNQALINDPTKGHKGLTSDKVLTDAAALFEIEQGRSYNSFTAASQTDVLLRKLATAITRVMDEHQDEINATGVEFKGFIPAIFGRLVSDHFNELAIGEAALKITAPEELVRNRRSRPDNWESEIIHSKFMSASWQKGSLFQGNSNIEGHQAFRMLIPEYYAASCLTCHGSPKGEVDKTGYPKEGAKEGDLGGVISVVLLRN